LGYNTNVRHRGVLFHIQTEDSGIGHPHVITHLFTEGTILATKRTAYADLVGQVDIEEKVRTLMKGQHKAMFLELRDGTHDTIAARILALSGHFLSDDQHVSPPDVDKGPLAPVPEAAIPKVPPPVPAAAKAVIRKPAEPSGVRVIMPAGLGANPRVSKPATVPPKPSVHPSAEPRKVQARSIFDTPDENGEFGEALISDKSLDEVILSYLTDDELDP
jgi:hypothetical protein